MTVGIQNETAARLLALAVTLEEAAEAVDPSRYDVEHLVGLGRTLVATIDERGAAATSGREAVEMLYAGAEFMRAWALHDTPNADALREQADLLERAMDAHIQIAAQS